MSKSEQRLADEWNARHGIGRAVTVKRDNGFTMYTTTRSMAWVLESGDAVVQVEGISGCYKLDRVQPCARRSC
jgi:hypothetical protein